MTQNPAEHRHHWSHCGLVVAKGVLRRLRRCLYCHTERTVAY